MASILSSLDIVLALGSCGLDCNTNVWSASRQVACAVQRLCRRKVDQSSRK